MERTNLWHECCFKDTLDSLSAFWSIKTQVKILSAVSPPVWEDEMGISVKRKLLHTRIRLQYLHNSPGKLNSFPQTDNSWYKRGHRQYVLSCTVWYVFLWSWSLPEVTALQQSSRHTSSVNSCALTCKIKQKIAVCFAVDCVVWIGGYFQPLSYHAGSLHGHESVFLHRCTPRALLHAGSSSVWNALGSAVIWHHSNLVQGTLSIYPTETANGKFFSFPAHIQIS